MSPDGKYIAVTNAGSRQNITVLRSVDGSIASQLNFDKRSSGRKQALYVGLAFAPQTDGGYRLFASRGPEDRASILNVDANGVVTDSGLTISDGPPAGIPAPSFMAGIAVDSTGSKLYVANNSSTVATLFKGSMSVLDVASNKVLGRVPTSGYPLAVASITKGPNADRKVYVSSERDALVSIVDVTDPTTPKALGDIATGSHPMAMILNPAQDRLYVANAGSDTISVVDTTTDKIVDTILVRPAAARALPGATPTGVALSPDGKHLYASLGDMNAVAVMEVGKDHGKLKGYLPAGWYPSAIVVAPDGKLFVSNAKGGNPRNPNGKNVGKLGHAVLNIIEGTVARIDPPGDRELRVPTLQVLANNRASGDLSKANDGVFRGLGIKHVVYIIKENRTYDQVMGDVPEGNGDPSLTLFGKSVTPNEHALAARFILMDNFYCCSEVSGDGWDWSTSGMASEYTERNVPFSYSSRPRSYDFEGQNQGTPSDLMDLDDVARAPGGYIWDGVAKKGLSYRNYGFYLSNADDATTPDGKVVAVDNTPNKKVLVGHTDLDFRQFDLHYPDSDALTKLGLHSQWSMKGYGSHHSPSRFSEWKREFDDYVKDGTFPNFSMIRVMCDHTGGTRPGTYSPRAMVADNDYSVGQIVEAISHSPFWADTAIFVVEDDAQDGQDHVDCHRSPAFVISPRIKASTVDHSFYNTDSVLRTMEALMGLGPMSQYDATAPLLKIFSSQPVNPQPYDAILPDKTIISEVNNDYSYRARDSMALDFAKEDRVPGDVMADILWGSVHGSGLSVKTLKSQR
jgi:YVTN family beta-propeller protein